MTVYNISDKLGGQLCAIQNRATREAFMSSSLLTDAVLVVYQDEDSFSLAYFQRKISREKGAYSSIVVGIPRI